MTKIHVRLVCKIIHLKKVTKIKIWFGIRTYFHFIYISVHHICGTSIRSVCPLHECKVQHMLSNYPIMTQ